MTSVESNPRSLDLSRALVAGLIATVVMTVVMALFGTNLMKMLGGMMLPGAGAGMQYLAGGIAHLMVGLIYAVVFAWLFGRVREWHPAVRGIVFGAAITAIALATMPLAGAMMGGGEAGSPCGPAAAGAAKNPCNPCNPCAARAANPCNPCGDARAQAVDNPCAGNPCANQAKSACSAAAKRAGNPCNPCGGGSGQGPWSNMISLINHLVYALALALIYGRAGRA
ncbi:MAG TPA: hypothetical protein VMS56_16360 [Thermoanaerobaculia bacterium]|nr:hypothetical protein [Thermoanaerobaculia bacterium]